MATTAVSVMASPNTWVCSPVLSPTGAALYVAVWRVSISTPPFTLRSSLRHCATSRTVAGSIPDYVIGIFHWHKPFGSTMVLGSTQPLTEISTRMGGKGSRCVGLTTLPPSCGDCQEMLGASTFWNPQGLSRPVQGLLIDLDLSHWIPYWYHTSASHDVRFTGRHLAKH